ncbi:hypothetical protein HAX54_000315 [Datura stramonium]|uniref:Uncharacterized protein n=1 Tax=Datura stramonium TaxID=4076 RepID=A0ABS8WPV9_DATST|nr:hypothetical protein [Datura stramonium]
MSRDRSLAVGATMGFQVYGNSSGLRGLMERDEAPMVIQFPGLLDGVGVYFVGRALVEVIHRLDHRTCSKLPCALLGVGALPVDRGLISVFHQ